MIELKTAMGTALQIEHLVLDYNGTIATDGTLITGVDVLIEELARSVTVHVLTADTHGTVAAQVDRLPCTIELIPAGPEDVAKQACIRRLGGAVTACVGNGRNDRLMLREAALGIAVIGREGASADALDGADIVVTSIIDALELVLNPLRLLATMRV